MKTWLIWLLAAPCQLAAAQVPTILPPLPETSLQASSTSTTVHNTAGIRYQYQQVHLENGQRIWLAPAWRGQTKLEPARKFLNPNLTGEVDALLLEKLNELAAEGWDLVEINNVIQPVGAEQKIETDLAFNDPKRPTYKGTTTIETNSHTRYLFRRALPSAKP